MAKPLHPFHLAILLTSLSAAVSCDDKKEAPEGTPKSEVVAAQAAPAPAAAPKKAAPAAAPGAACDAWVDHLYEIGDPMFGEAKVLPAFKAACRKANVETEYADHLKCQTEAADKAAFAACPKAKGLMRKLMEADG